MLSRTILISLPFSSITVSALCAQLCLHQPRQPRALAAVVEGHRARGSDRGSALFAGQRTEPQPLDLREDEPHPVGFLAAVPQFGADLAVNRVLGSDKSLEVVRVAHLVLRNADAGERRFNRKPVCTIVTLRGFEKEQ